MNKLPLPTGGDKGVGRKISFSVIIPNLNGSSFLEKLLPSLNTAIKNCPDAKFEIILVDNGSTDNSLEVFNKYILNSKIILLDKNKGFSGAVKVGIDSAKHNYVCLLNNDLVLDSLWFKKITDLIYTNKDKKVATICGTVLNKDGSIIESQGMDFFYSGKAINLNNNLPVQSPKVLEHLSTTEVWGSSAAAVVYQKNALLKSGSYDPVFFNYLEDVDVSLRLHNHNYHVFCLPQAITYHLGGGTSSRFGYLRQYYSFRNWFFVIIKNFTAKEICRHLPSIASQRLRNLSYLILNCPIYLIPILPVKAIIEVIINTPYLLKSNK